MYRSLYCPGNCRYSLHLRQCTFHAKNSTGLVIIAVSDVCGKSGAGPGACQGEGSSVIVIHVPESAKSVVFVGGNMTI